MCLVFFRMSRSMFFCTAYFNAICNKYWIFVGSHLYHNAYEKRCEKRKIKISLSRVLRNRIVQYHWTASKFQDIEISSRHMYVLESKNHLYSVGMFPIWFLHDQSKGFCWIENQTHPDSNQFLRYLWIELIV